MANDDKLLEQFHLSEPGRVSPGYGVAPLCQPNFPVNIGREGEHVFVQIGHHRQLLTPKYARQLAFFLEREANAIDYHQQVGGTENGPGFGDPGDFPDWDPDDWGGVYFPEEDTF